MLPVSLRVALVLLLVAAGAGRANAQSDPDECGPYVLSGTLLTCSASGSPQQQLRTGAFIAGSPPLGTMLAQALGIEVATAPVGSSTGGFVWTRSAEGIAPRRTSPTYGPAFSERALTIGRRNFSAGFNFLHRQYDRIDGNDLDQVEPFEFQGGSLAVSSSTLHLDVETDTLAAFASYGLLDSLDVGILVPWVQVSVRGTSSIFGQVDEELQRVNLDASGSGIGDIAIFGKYRFWPRTIEPPNLDAVVRQAGLALAVTARMPSGNENELRGLGLGRVLISGVASATIHRFSPHVNVGYEFWTSGIDTPQDAAGVPDTGDAAGG